jgi:carbamoyltransferase
MSSILGISAGFHDAALSVVSESGDILYAGHSERYSKTKNDPNINKDQLMHVLATYHPNHFAFYERPWMHNWQQFRSGQREFGAWTTQGALEAQFNMELRGDIDFSCYNHHLSHAAAGFQTSPFDWAAVVVIDAIGEMDTISIYRAWYDREGVAHYDRLWRQSYPHSIGLFYSAITKHVGLKPMEDEYILMGMAGWGNQNQAREIAGTMEQMFMSNSLEFNTNFHIGMDKGYFSRHKDMDIAAGAQLFTERLIQRVMRKAKKLTKCDNLVYMGGVALNCVANSKLGMWNDIWIMPNPGDAGSSLGAAALKYKKKLNWEHAYLGTDIPGEYPVEALVEELATKKIAGVASGRAEFGPRALGNRSLLADPRGNDIKDRVNEIKRRQKFRPFAPMILEEHVHDYFKMPSNMPTSPYMQVVADVLDPDSFPAITHVDGTARVQTVSKDCGSDVRKLLEAWYDKTGCPMLLNTSLNIKGEPMVDTREDADRFENKYNVKVYS